jgi:hypothetical protein
VAAGPADGHDGSGLVCHIAAHPVGCVLHPPPLANASASGASLGQGPQRLTEGCGAMKGPPGRRVDEF